MTKDDALEIALDYVLRTTYWTEGRDRHDTLKAIKEALAHPAQEPVATVVSESGNQEITMSWWHEPALPIGTKLYTAPPQREWVGLTDDEMWSADYGGSDIINLTYAKAIEAKLKEKNDGT